MGAGVTWTSRTTSAPWAGRHWHTSVTDAAGTIYVLGGTNSGRTIYYNDVWASTDGGARPDSVKGGSRGVLKGILKGYSRGTTGYCRVLQEVLRGSIGVLRSTRGGTTAVLQGVLEGCRRGADAVLAEFSRGFRGIQRVPRGY